MLEFTMQQFMTLWQQMLQYGGVIAIVLLFLSIVAVTVIVYKSIQLSVLGSTGFSRTEDALAMWRQKDRSGALARMEGANEGKNLGSAQIVGYAMRSLDAATAEPVVREEVERLAHGHYQRLKSHLPILETIAAVSPLLGLFGTVLGMIKAFRAMEQAGSQVDPSVLSGGIWQALLTTGIGLAVAIPTVLAYQWLDRKSTRQFERLEDQVTRVFTSR